MPAADRCDKLIPILDLRNVHARYKLGLCVKQSVVTLTAAAIRAPRFLHLRR